MISRSIKHAKVYLKASFSKMLESKLALFIWTVVGFASVFALAYAWLVAGRGKPDVGALESSKIFAYYILRFSLWYFVGGVFSWIIDDLVRNGKLSNYLLKPGNFLIYPMFWEQGWKLASFVLAIPAVIIFSVALGVSPFYGVTLGSFLLSIPAIVIGGAIFAEFQVLVGLSIMWIGSSRGASALFDLGNNVLGGLVVPLLLAPIWFQNICSLLAFKYMFAFPIEIIQNQYGIDLIIRGFIIQGLWFVFLFFICRKAYFAGVKRYEGFGN